MGRLIYGLNVSVDVYVETIDKSLEWSAVDEELHGWFNDRFRTISASIYGRGLYQTMAAHWPTAADDPDISVVEAEFARLWNAVPRYVFSKSLQSVVSNSELVRDDVDGLLVDARAPSQMADAIEKLARDPDLARRLSSAGRRKIEASFHSGVSAQTIARRVREKSRGG